MKKLMFTISLLAFTTMSYAGISDSRVEFKCYVELADGANTIYYAQMKSKQKAAVRAKLVGRKINASNGIKRAVVSKVLECVEADKEFALSAAKQMELVTFR